MPKMKVVQRKPRVSKGSVSLASTRKLKVKKLSRRDAKALNRLIKSEHQPITSKALIYTGRRAPRIIDPHEPLNDPRAVITNAQSLSGDNRDILRVLLKSGSSDED